MPDVGGWRAGFERRATAWFPRCANPGCSTGWVHVWRNRRVPVFEGQWACSSGCMEALITAAVRRESSGDRETRVGWSHRIPIGLLLVEQGAITETQLREALAARREANENDIRLGEWLVKSGVLRESALTRGLCAQWNCPSIALQDYRSEETASLLPRLLADMAGAVPVRVAAGRLLHLAFGGAVDRSVCYAVERVTGLRVAAGIAGDAEFRRARARYLETTAPRAEFLEAAGAMTLAQTMARQLERERPAEARLVRVHDFYWLRSWKQDRPAPGIAAVADIDDLLCTLPHECGAQPS